MELIEITARDHHLIVSTTWLRRLDGSGRPPSRMLAVLCEINSLTPDELSPSRAVFRVANEIAAVMERRPDFLFELPGVIAGCCGTGNDHQNPADGAFSP